MGRYLVPVEVKAPSAEEAREGLHRLIDASLATATFNVVDVLAPRPVDPVQAGARSDEADLQRIAVGADAARVLDELGADRLEALGIESQLDPEEARREARELLGGGEAAKGGGS